MSHHPILERYRWFDRQIRDNRFPNAKTLAERFELSRKQTQRDIEFLRNRLNAPLVYEPAKRGYRYSDDSFQLPPLYATERQLLTLLMARHLLKTGGGRLERDIGFFADSLFYAVADRRITPARLDRLFSASWSGNAPAEAEIFRPVLSALTQERTLQIRYSSPASEDCTERVVEPHHLQYYQGSWLLLAWCRTASDWRKFYLSRMESASILKDAFAPRSSEDWRQHIEGAFGIYQTGVIRQVRLRFRPARAKWIREQYWHENQRMTLLPNGSLELSLPVADFREIRLRVLQYGADVEVLEPEELRDMIKEEIGRMAELYRKK
ncbi:MAG: WYL domain-containing protein [Deltaproteobacteria bacterium]|nr:WYL domain-containing protein [Deltaproteobacteria bacterium]